MSRAEAVQMTLEDGEEIKYHALVMTDVDCVGWLASRSGQLNPSVYRLELQMWTVLDG